MTDSIYCQLNILSRAQAQSIAKESTLCDKKWRSFTGWKECKADGADCHTQWLCVPWEPQWWWPQGVTVDPICVILKMLCDCTMSDVKNQDSIVTSTEKSTMRGIFVNMGLNSN